MNTRLTAVLEELAREIESGWTPADELSSFVSEAPTLYVTLPGSAGGTPLRLDDYGMSY